jgi:hypothetical protein
MWSRDLKSDGIDRPIIPVFQGQKVVHRSKPISVAWWSESMREYHIIEWYEAPKSIGFRISQVL